MDTYSYHFSAVVSLECWGCLRPFRAMPEDLLESDALEYVCPECDTSHYASEDADGNVSITEAVQSDGTILHRQASIGPSTSPDTIP